MTKIGEHLRIRTDEEIEAKKQKERRWIFALVVIIALGIVVAAITENTPEARKDRSERNATAERKQKVEAETERNYKQFKEAEELQKMRPLNSVEDRVVKDYARQAAEQQFPKPSPASGISSERNSPETWQGKVIAIKNEMLRLEPPSLCEYGDRELLRGADAPDEILSTAKKMLEGSISISKSEKGKWLPGGNTDPAWNKLQARMYPNPKDRKAYRETMVKQYEELIYQKEQVLVRVIALINTAH